jgi:[acyl-carrier-protein] S-malonyltransferase
VDHAGIRDPLIPLVGYVEAEILRGESQVRADLKAQLTSRVRWTESVRRMLGDGIVAFAEIGSGEVLLGLIRRIDRSPSLIALDRPESLDAFLG